jgi:predicted RNA-binding Zn-ribbon protein involved in translation (DUF1610 family)
MGCEESEMARYLILAMECPLCGTNINLDSQSAQVRCPGCGNEIPLRDRLCPYCGAYHNKTASGRLRIWRKPLQTRAWSGC